MKIKFNLFERVAALFVLFAIGSAFAVTVGMGIKKGWFDQKMELKTYVESADGLHAGTPVNFAGLRIGSVTNIDLKTESLVEVRFKVRKRFAKRIHTDSIIRIVRPFIIGDKALEVVAGKMDGGPVKDGQLLIAQNAPDFLEFLGGNKLGAYVESLNVTMQNLQKLAEAFLSNERSDKIIELFDQLFPLMEKMNAMASEVSTLTASMNEKKKMIKILDEFMLVSKEMNRFLPIVSKDMPELTGNILTLTKNLNQLSSDLNQIVPVVKTIAPEIPRTSEKAIQALDETVLTLKAMQKTWFLRSNVKEVKEEDVIKMREPASK